MAEEEPLERKNQLHQKDHWDRIDRRILLFFGFWFSLAIIATSIAGYFIGIESFFVIITVLITLTVGAFFTTGMLAFFYYRKTSIIPTKKVIVWAVKLSLVFGLVFAVVLFILIVFYMEDQIGTELLVFMFIGLYIGGILTSLATFFLFYFFSFGIMAVISVFIRRKTPDFLVEITKITSNITETTKKRDRKKYRGYVWLAWAYGIPDVLDTRTLKIDMVEPRKRFPWPSFKKAMFWQFFFGIVLVIYISFSPFLWDFADMQDLFMNSSCGTAFLPLLIIPWFIYLRLNARLSGPVKEFHIFDGLSARMFQTLVAFGTLVLLVRMALKNPAILEVMYSFIVFFIFFVSGVFIGTFVYFNYFEDELAQDVYRRYNELKDRSIEK